MFRGRKINFKYFSLIQRSLCINKQNSVDNHIRKAHAAEIFRSSFYEYQHTDLSVSVFDLDQLIISERVRPSLLLNPLELSGRLLGTVTRVLPKPVSSFVTEVVDDATLQVFNDSIRDLQVTNNENLDVKDALKYHRSIKSEISSVGLDKSFNAQKELITNGLYKLLGFTSQI